MSGLSNRLLRKGLNVQIAQGDLEGALKSYEQDLAIIQELANSDEGNVEWQRDLVISYVTFADLMTARDRDAARRHYIEALSIMRRLVSAGRLAPRDAYFIEEIETRLAALTPVASGT